MPIKCSNFHTTALISHASKVMLKIFQAWLQQYVNWELPDVQAGFINGRGTRDQMANIRWIIEKAREFQKKKKTCTSVSLTMLKPLTMWTTTNWKILRGRNTRPPYLPLERFVCRSSRKSKKWNNRLVPNWERTISKLYTVTLFI